MHRSRPILIFAALVLVLPAMLISGCTRMRFVIDAVPAQDDLTETMVLGDGSRSLIFSTPKVALIDVSGLIGDTRAMPGRSAAATTVVSELTEGLGKAGRDADVRAVILRLNSAGGTVTASDVLYREIIRFREETGRPVIALMADVSASGAFYIACAADYVIAHPTTVTGSIGVVMQTMNFSEGMRRIGIQADAIASGPNKTAGSPFSPMSADQRAVLQEMVDEYYASFVGIVRDRRPDLAEEQLTTIFDGRVVTGTRAAELGLIDGVGDLHDAFEIAKEQAHLTRARLMRYHRPIDHIGSAFATAPTPPAQMNLLQLNVGTGGAMGSTGFLYLWDPTVW